MHLYTVIICTNGMTIDMCLYMSLAVHVTTVICVYVDNKQLQVYVCH